MSRNSNFPNAQLDNVPSEVVTKMIENVEELSSLGKITRSADMDEEFEKRVKQFLDLCKRKGLRPGIESLCAALGTSRAELHNWKNGIGGTSERRQESVKQVVQLIHAFLEQLGMGGKLNPAAYIWLCKNWMGYTDSIIIDTKETTNNIPELSREEIHARFRQLQEKPEKPDLD